MTTLLASASKRFHIITYGCQMNVRDSGWLAARLQRLGLVQSELAEADAVIVNTCSVREKPERKVAATIRRIQQTCRKNVKIAILGCVAQQLGEELFGFAPEICLVAGGDSLADAPERLIEALDAPRATASLLDFSAHYRELPPAGERLVGPFAFVNIMQGCDNFCSYCIVPFTRGREKSRSFKAIIAECEERLAQGALEITLLGQNVNAWRDGDMAFPDLLRAIDALGPKRLRFITPHPKDLGDDTIACFGELASLCPALHLPLQAGSDRILALMRRRYTGAQYLDLIKKLRDARPDIAFTTDLIVGFPGETKADFEETLALAAKAGFAASFSFRYSDRPGTRASLMPDKLPESIKSERLARLQALQEELTSEWLAARIGKETELVIERESPRGPANSWQGRDPWGVAVHFQADAPPAGNLARVVITDAKKHCLVACLAPS